MSSYLDIAEQILAERKRPLSAKSILETAYELGVVPVHLHGQTQHKTLQARLSEDIVAFREQSRFFRTEPGKFFLRRFLTDRSVPDKYRTPVATRRRVRQLIPKESLAVPKSHLEDIEGVTGPIDPARVYQLLDFSTSIDPKLDLCGVYANVWSFAIVRRGDFVLTYRSGSYREDRDCFLLRRSIGFGSMVEPSDQTLFNPSEYGIPERGIATAKMDLEIMGEVAGDDPAELSAKVEYFIYSPETSALIGVIYYNCPVWFEPTHRRLSMHDVKWYFPEKTINNIEDFDPWSQMVLKAEIEAT